MQIEILVYIMYDPYTSMWWRNFNVKEIQTGFNRKTDEIE
jgi:hypothetical protein